MSLATKGKESRPWWYGRIEFDPESVPPPEWSAEHHANSSADTGSIDSDRLRNPWGVDAEDIAQMAAIYGWFDGGSEESGGRPEQPEPEQTGQPTPEESGEPVPEATPGSSAAYPEVPPEYQGWCRPETYAAYEDTRTMYEKYGVNTEDLATYSEMGLERDSDCPSFDGVPYGRGR